VRSISSCEEVKSNVEELISSCDEVKSNVEELISSCEEVKSNVEEAISSCVRSNPNGEEAISSCGRSDRWLCQVHFGRRRLLVKRAILPRKAVMQTECGSLTLRSAYVGKSRVLGVHRDRVGRRSFLRAWFQGRTTGRGREVSGFPCKRASEGHSGKRPSNCM